MMKSFRYIVKKEGEHILCMCLDVNMVTQGRTKEEAQKSLKYCLKAHYEFAKQEGCEPWPAGENPEPKGWFKECFGFDPRFYKVHKIEVNV